MAAPPEQDPTPPPAPPAAGLAANPGKIGSLGIDLVLALVDQALTSAVSFLVNLFLARWMAPDGYGAFAVAFATFLFASGLFQALVLEPVTVLGPAAHAERLAKYFREQLKVHALLVGGIAVVMLGVGVMLWVGQPGSPLAGAVVGSGLALPFLLLQWLARRMCYVLRRPAIAVLGSGFNLAFVLAGLFVLHRLDWVGPLTSFLLMGVGSLLTAWFLLVLALRGGDGSPDEGVRWRGVLADNWRYGRWLVGSTLLNSISTQTPTFLLAALLGLDGAGILRAMQIPMLVMTQAQAAVGALLLARFSYDFGNGRTQSLRQKARLVSLGLAAVVLCLVGVLALLSGRVEQLFFGGRYAPHAWLMAVLALVPVFMGACAGHSMSMRASQRPQFDLVANAVAAPTTVISALALIHWWGIAGAAASMVGSAAVYSVWVLKSYYSAPRAQESPP